MEPPIWKWIFGFVSQKFKDEYKEEKNKYDEKFSLMMKKCENYIELIRQQDEKKTEVKMENSEKYEDKNCRDRKISKKDIIGFIIKELRSGDKEVKF